MIEINRSRDGSRKSRPHFMHIIDVEVAHELSNSNDPLPLFSLAFLPLSDHCRF